MPPVNPRQSQPTTPPPAPRPSQEGAGQGVEFRPWTVQYVDSHEDIRMMSHEEDLMNVAAAKAARAQKTRPKPKWLVQSSVLKKAKDGKDSVESTEKVIEFVVANDHIGESNIVKFEYVKRPGHFDDFIGQNIVVARKTSRMGQDGNIELYDDPMVTISGDQIVIGSRYLHQRDDGYDLPFSKQIVTLMREVKDFIEGCPGAAKRDKYITKLQPALEGLLMACQSGS